MNFRALTASLTALYLIPFEATAAEVAGTVDVFGSPDRLHFEGAKSFPAEALRRGLSWDLDFHLASHPAAPLKGYLDTIEKRLTRGYLHEGFPDVRVAASAHRDAGCIKVTIAEGPRYLCGDIIVTGTKRVPPDFIAKWAEKSGALLGTNSSSLLWNKTSPASFTDWAQQSMTMIVSNAFLDLGFQMPSFDVKLTTRKDRGVADYVVRIDSEGPKSVVGEIDVLGVVTNSPESIIKFLAVGLGTEVNRDLVPRLTERLRASGRFVKHIVRILPPDEQGKSLLEIEVMELDEAPPLGQPLSPLQQTLLKAQAWLSTNAIVREDIVISVPLREFSPALEDHRATLIVSHQGFLIEIRHAITNATNTLGFAFHMTTNRFSILSGSRLRQLAMPRTRGQIQPFLNVEPAENPVPGNQFNISVGAGFSNAQSNAPIAVQMSFTPAAFLNLAHKFKHRISLNREYLSLTNDDGFAFYMDSKSGRPRVEHPEKSVTWHFSHGALDRSVRALESLTSHWPNDANATNALTSIGVFALREFVNFSFGSLTTNTGRAVQVAPSLAVLNRVPLPHILEPFNRFKQPDIPDDQTFGIPPDFEALAQQNMVARFAGFVVPAADLIFDRGSWPWTFLREGFFLAANKGIYTDSEAERIKDSEDTGPIACLLAASFFHKIGAPAARSFAMTGFTRLSSDRFLEDCAVLLDGQSISCEVARRALAALGQLNDQDARTLGAVLDPEPRVFLDTIRQLPPPARDIPISGALRPALERLWNNYLKDRIRTRLRALALSNASDSR
ncbi:MAG: hypothetical protein L0Y58_06940 [Verrucomicrobia subdivision 3 bacterium]|nr:hypothetical protein [Limisphaerales bacterium]